MISRLPERIASLIVTIQLKKMITAAQIDAPVPYAVWC
jgi:hypothetical protein